MTRPIGIGHEFHDAPRHIDCTPNGATAQLVRSSHIDQHHVTFHQLCGQLGGSQVLDHSSCQSDLGIDVLDPRFVSHATDRDDPRVPEPFLVVVRRRRAGNVLGTQRKSPSPNRRRTLRQRHEEQP